MEKATSDRNPELHFVEWPGSGTPIVLLHGLGGNALSWSGFARRLSGRRLIAIDLPGHGESPPLANWELGTIADEVVALVVRHWPQGQIWAGHSWGGKLAVAAAARSHSTRGLILVDAVPARSLPSANPDKTADDLFAGELEPWTNMNEAIGAAQRLPQYTPWNPDVEQAFLRGIQVAADGRIIPRLSREKAVAILRPLFETDLTAIAERLDAPVLVVSAGDKSPIKQAMAFPNATPVAVSGNHWLHINNADGLASVVLPWLAGIDSSIEPRS